MTDPVTVGDKERQVIKELWEDAQKSKYSKRLTPWEYEFLGSIYDGSLVSHRVTVTWSAKQQDRMAQIERKMYQ